MSDGDRNTEERKSLTQAEVDDLVARRKARQRNGWVLIVLGGMGFLATMTAMIVREAGVQGGLGIIGICFVMVAVGAGFLDPSKITPGFWK